MTLITMVLLGEKLCLLIQVAVDREVEYHEEMAADNVKLIHFQLEPIVRLRVFNM